MVAVIVVLVVLVVLVAATWLVFNGLIKRRTRGRRGLVADRCGAQAPARFDSKPRQHRAGLRSA